MQGTHVTKENEEDIGWSGHLRKRGHMGQMGLMQQHNGPGVMPHHFNQVSVTFQAV